jgi:uncharacterized protein
VIFLDTSAIYAMADQADPNHVTACDKFDLALKSGETFFLHNYILVESAALLQSRLGLRAATHFLNDANSFQIEWVDLALHQEAKKELERIGKQRISFVDCMSFIVMRKRDVRKAFVFDPDFHNQGFLVY